MSEKSKNRFQFLKRDKKSSLTTSNQIENLTKLFKITDKVKIEDVSKFVGMNKDELLEFLAENYKFISGIEIEGDNIVVSSSDGVKEFVELLDNQFDLWRKKETLKIGKRIGEKKKKSSDEKRNKLDQEALEYLIPYKPDSEGQFRSRILRYLEKIDNKLRQDYKKIGYELSKKDIVMVLPIINNTFSTKLEKLIQFFRFEPCLQCIDNKKRINSTCPSCKGEKVIVIDKKEFINIPKDLKNGDIIRIQKKGHQYKFDETPGDIFIKILIK